MEKVVYALWARPEREVELVSRLRDASLQLAQQLSGLEIIRCSVQAKSALPHALVSGWLPCIDASGSLETYLASLGCVAAHGYLVTESVAAARRPAGDALSLAWLAQPVSLGQYAFLDEVVQRVAVLVEQPSSYLVRQTVARPLDAHAPGLRMLVLTDASEDALRAALAPYGSICRGVQVVRRGPFSSAGPEKARMWSESAALASPSTSNARARSLGSSSGAVDKGASKRS